MARLPGGQTQSAPKHSCSSVSSQMNQAIPTHVHHTDFASVWPKDPLGTSAGLFLIELAQKTKQKKKQEALGFLCCVPKKTFNRTSFAAFLGAGQPLGSGARESLSFQHLEVWTKGYTLRCPQEGAGRLPVTVTGELTSRPKGATSRHSLHAPAGLGNLLFSNEGS